METIILRLQPILKNINEKLIWREIQEDGYYWLDNGDNISVINIQNQSVKYELGRIYTC